jgi:hypothetical protein
LRSNQAEQQLKMGVQGLATYVAKHKDYKYQEHIDLVEWAKQKGFGMKQIIYFIPALIFITIFA